MDVLQQLLGRTKPESATFTVTKAAPGVTVDTRGASLTDTGDVTVVAETQRTKTIEQYLDEIPRDSGAQDSGAAETVVAQALAQANAVQVTSLVGYKGLDRDGVDQINPVVNPVLLRTELGRFSLPSLVTVNPFNVTFNAAGACFCNGEQIKPADYDPNVLSKAFILGGPKSEAGLWPIFGYDIAVRAFSTEVGDARVNVSCFDTTRVSSDSNLDANAVQMYAHDYHLREVTGTGKIVAALAKGNKVLNVSGISTTLETEHYVYFEGLAAEMRNRDCAACISVSSEEDEYPNAMIRLSGINAILTITPLILTKESLARVINNLDKDASGYVNALVNIRNANQGNFNY